MYNCESTIVEVKFENCISTWRYSESTILEAQFENWKLYFHMKIWWKYNCGSTICSNPLRLHVNVMDPLRLHVNVMDFWFHEIFDIRRAYYATFSRLVYIIFFIIAMVYVQYYLTSSISKCGGLILNFCHPSAEVGNE